MFEEHLFKFIRKDNIYILLIFNHITLKHFLYQQKKSLNSVLSSSLKVKWRQLFIVGAIFIYLESLLFTLQFNYEYLIIFLQIEYIIKENDFFHFIMCMSTYNTYNSSTLIKSGKTYLFVSLS